MTDALSVAQRALEKATEAMTQIASHERECARRYEDAKDVMNAVDSKLDALIEATGIARGKSLVVKAMFGGIPNAMWTLMFTFLGSAITVFVLRFLFPLQVP